MSVACTRQCAMRCRRWTVEKPVTRKTTTDEEFTSKRLELPVNLSSGTEFAVTECAYYDVPGVPMTVMLQK